MIKMKNECRLVDYINYRLVIPKESPSLQIQYRSFSLFVMFAAVAMPCTPVPEP